MGGIGTPCAQHKLRAPGIFTNQAVLSTDSLESTPAWTRISPVVAMKRFPNPSRDQTISNRPSYRSESRITSANWRAHRCRCQRHLHPETGADDV